MLIFLDFSPEKDTEVYADNRTSTFKCCWSFVGEEARSMDVVAEYQNERRFFRTTSCCGICYR